MYDALGSAPAGLAPAEAASRLDRFGPNTLATAPPRHLLRRLASNFLHVMAVLLWIGGGIALAAGLPELAIAIWIVNVVNGIFSFWQEYRAERATEALRRLLPVQASVVRAGTVIRVDAETLVPGDVILLEEGDRISADARLVEHSALRVDQSTLTGESRLVRKAADPCDPADRVPAEIPNLVFAGTTVATGRGRAVVTVTGADTLFGRVAGLTQAMPATESPLQRELRRLSLTVSIVAVSVGVGFFVLALSLGGLSFARGFTFALGMIVAFVPEGLLPTVTLALAMGTQRMARRNALVKRLSSVEALGCTTVICTDKTGTLTQNEMTVRTALTWNGTYGFSGVGYAPEGTVTPDVDDDLRLLLEMAVLASNAKLLPPDEGTPRWTIVGDPTEAALCTALAKAVPGEKAAPPDGARVAEYPFDSTRKRMSVAVLREGTVTLAVKGAPLEVLARSASRGGPHGAAALEDADRERMTAEVESLARQGLRVLGIARRTLDAPPTASDPGDVERDLEFLGIVAMHDPPRPEVSEAIRTCRRAGIRIVMVTGDHGVTAETIGRRIGMIGDERVTVLNGERVDRMTEAQLAEAVRGDVLFARVSPEHKLRIVKAFQALGEVVAVTGDGVNDAPALKKADIGVAMGLSGTDVAKEAADVVLLDDNFASIVSAVEEGRAVYDNIKKFTSYILTSNTPEAVPFVAFAFSGGRIPIALDVMHILAVDLGTDLAPALALGAEPPEPGVMDRPPRSMTAHLVDRRLLARSYLWLGPFQAAFVMAAFFGAYRLAGFDRFLDLPADGTAYRAAAGMALAAVVTTQIGNLFAQRSERISLFRIGFGGNRLLWWGIASEVAVIFAIVYVPWLQRVIGTAAFPTVGWLWLLLGIPILPLVDETRKAWRRGRERRRCM